MSVASLLAQLWSFLSVSLKMGALVFLIVFESRPHRCDLLSMRSKENRCDEHLHHVTKVKFSKVHYVLWL